MKIKSFNIKIFSFLFFILFIVFFFIYIFIPDVKLINKSKIELKDLNLKVRDNIQQNRVFSFLNNKEKDIFRKENLKLKHRIPKIRTRRELTELLEKNFLYFQKLAQKDGVDCLAYVSNLEKLNAISRFFSKNGKKSHYLLSFCMLQLKNIEKEYNKASSLIKDEFFVKLKGLKYYKVFLCFTGKMKGLLDFVNHIAWGKYYIVGDKISVSLGNVSHIFWMEIKIYFKDFRKSQYFNNSTREKNKKDLFVDFNSDILLKNIYFNLPKECKKRELPNVK